MTRSRTVFISTMLGLTLIGAAALAQGELFPRRADPEVRAAQLSLADAVEHLQKARNARNAQNMRALAYITLAQTELQNAPGGLEGLDDR